MWTDVRRVFLGSCEPGEEALEREPLSQCNEDDWEVRKLTLVALDAVQDTRVRV
jgi:hypothetical protein